MKTISEAQLHKMLCRAVKESGSQSSLAREIGISRQYLGDMLINRRPINQKVLEYFKLEQIILYRRV